MKQLENKLTSIFKAPSFFRSGIFCAHCIRKDGLPGLRVISGGRFLSKIYTASSFQRSIFIQPYNLAQNRVCAITLFTPLAYLAYTLFLYLNDKKEECIYIRGGIYDA